MAIIAGIDSSSLSGAVGILSDGRLTAEGFVQNGLTHSQTLLPMIKDTFERAGVTAKDVDLFSITTGPGSFTGLRIGLSTVKGMAAAFDTKCVGVSSLEAAAYGAYLSKQYCGCIICAVQDARCNQFYNALFCVDNEGIFERITDDRALSSDDLASELQKITRPIVLTGDGAELLNERLSDLNFIVLTGDEKYIHGEAVARLGEKYADTATDFAAVMPKYLRLPQAQRELKNKLKKD